MMNFSKWKCFIPTVILVCVGVAITLYAVILSFVCKHKKGFAQCDMLRKTLWKKANYHVTWWTLAHFLTYFGLAIFFPCCGIPIILLSVFWECVEKVGGIALQKVYKSAKWWDWSALDIVANISGFICGYVVNQLFIKRSFASGKTLAQLFGWENNCCESVEVPVTNVANPVESPVGSVASPVESVASPESLVN